MEPSTRDQRVTIAREFLAAAKAGEDRSVELAEALAAAVLDEPEAKLALEVLEGGALTIARAIRLAEVMVTKAVAAPPSKNEAAEPIKRRGRGGQ